MKNWLANMIASFGLFFAVFGANAGCCLFFHQPKKPDLSKYKKF